MNASYRLGRNIVLSTLAASALVCIVFAMRSPVRPPSGENMADLGLSLGEFRLTERSGDIVTEKDLGDRVWVASFVFSRCTTSCPVICKKVKDLQTDLADTGVKLASISVDPEHDTPEVLREFASRYNADPDRWLFLTGDQKAVYDLILDRFKISVAASRMEDRKEGAELVAHSDRLVLLGPGNRILGAFVSSDADAVKRLHEAARAADRMASARRMGWVLNLPAVNASLNALCGSLLVVGWSLIRRGKVREHALCMISAIAVSAVFLSCYLVYHYIVGSVSFRGVGPIRTIYLTILLSHTLLAIAVVPLILITVYRAARKQFVQHSRIARVTFPIWLYVSITGVVVYLMLYQIPLPSSSI